MRLAIWARLIKQFHRRRVSLRIAVGFLAVMGLNYASNSPTQAADSMPTIRVRVLNFTKATPQTITSAEREAGRIFGDAGLNVVWLNCPLRQTTVNPTDPCQQPLDPSHVIVRLLSDRTRKGLQDSVFGFAILPALASVYYESLITLARTYRAEMIDLPTILGCVMAHEIGHLLLGSNHSATGIMKAHWGRKQVRELIKGDLLFTSQQSKLIQTEGQTRMHFEMSQVQATGSIQQPAASLSFATAPK